MAKRKFRIEAGRYGGELTIGEVNADFVDYWLEQDDEGELIDHLQKLEWGDEPEVEGIPLIKKDFLLGTSVTILNMLIVHMLIVTSLSPKFLLTVAMTTSM